MAAASPPMSPKGGPATRHIDINSEAQKTKFATNVIKTTKYTLFPFSLDFFPIKNLYEQFQRLANLYFLIVGGLQLVDGLSPTGRFTTLSTLAGVMTFSACKSAYEDYQRYKKDKEVNARRAFALKDGRWQRVPYVDLKVGMIVKVMNTEHHPHNDVPCDILALTSSDPEGILFVETANLDGETSLKQRRCHYRTLLPANASEAQIAERFKGASVECEQPNKDLYNFSANLTMNDGEMLNIGVDQVIYRGSQLRKIEWFYGLVVFTGAETKVMMNASKPPHKASRVERLLNRLLLTVLALQFTLCLICAVALSQWNDKEAVNAWYLDEEEPESAKLGAIGFFTFLILFNNFIPISLYVSLEFIKFVQGRMMEQDLVMYYPDKDMPAVAKTTDLNEELGQVSMVFSDKTGTLTRNVMNFMKFTVKGDIYGRGITEIGRAAAERRGQKVIDERPEAVITSDFPFWDPEVTKGAWFHLRDAAAMKRLFQCMAVCHTVVTEYRDGEMLYDAESPDEKALVEAAAVFGYKFVGKNSGKMEVQMGPVTGEFVVLNVMEFSSDRKRMSVVVEMTNEEGEKTKMLMMKGADMVMFPRLQKDPTEDETEEVRLTTEALTQFGEEGLRTLVFSEKELDESEYEAWNREWVVAKNIIDNKERNEQLAALAERIEVGMSLIGSAAIEDKLQFGVPQTISTMMAAEIGVWMLTGDKLETAINIGFACALLHDSMSLFTLHTNSDKTYIDEQLKLCISDAGDKAIVIEGDALGCVLGDPTLQELFYKAAIKCASVICCRVSPRQKADVVDLIRSFDKTAVTLAIGDGANDVPMIQAAHVGIGISGMEGQQATNASDYAIGQFRYLHRLLFIHGRYNYVRLCNVITYFFYKNGLLVLTQFWFCLFNAWTGQSIYEQWTLAAYNVIFTSFPCLVVGIFDRDVLNTDHFHTYPALYKQGKDNKDLSVGIFVRWQFTAVVHSALCFFITMHGWGTAVDPDGKELSLSHQGTMTYMAIVFVGTLRYGLQQQSWTWLHHLTMWGSLVISYIFILAYGELPTFGMYRVGRPLISNAGPWLVLLLTIGLTLLVEYLWYYGLYNLIPVTKMQLWRKMQLVDSTDMESATRVPKEIRKTTRRASVNKLMADEATNAIFAGYEADELVVDPSTGTFLNFFDQDLENEFIEYDLGTLFRYKLGVALSAIASLLLLLSVVAFSGFDDVVQVAAWAVFSLMSWICLIILVFYKRIKYTLHPVMLLLMFIGFTMMTIANLKASQEDPKTHPVTTGIILLGILAVIRPQLVHAIHYNLICIISFLAWYQVFRVKEWEGADFAVRFLELLIVSVTGLVTLYYSERFMRQMFVSQKQVMATMGKMRFEERRSLQLLGNILPAGIVREVRQNNRQLSAFSMFYPHTSVLASDIVSFTKFSSTKESSVVLEMLNRMFTKFDGAAETLGVEKIKTIGDAYICASGVPAADPHHMEKIADMGIMMIDCIDELNREGLSTLKELNIRIRVGIATGSMRAGVVGLQKVSYDIYGDAMTQAQHMEESGLPNRVHLDVEMTTELEKFYKIESVEGRQVLGERISATQYDRSTETEVPYVDIQMDDVYAFLEDSDRERHDLIQKWKNFDGKRGKLLNFEADFAETDFVEYLGVVAFARMTGQRAIGLVIFVIVTALIGLLFPDDVVGVMFIVCALATIVHFVVVCISYYRHRAPDMVDDVDDDNEQEDFGRPTTTALSSIRKARGLDSSLTGNQLNEDRPKSYTMFSNVFTAFSIGIALLVPLGTPLLIDDNQAGTVVVFVVVSCLVYVMSYVIIRFKTKLLIACIHFFFMTNSYIFARGVRNDWDNVRGGGDYFALILAYLLSMLSVYVMERTIRESFVASMNVSYRNAEVTKAVVLCDNILNNTLPRSIVRRMKANPDKEIVDSVPHASALFIYFEGMDDEVEGSMTPRTPQDGQRRRLITNSADASKFFNRLNKFLGLLDRLCVVHNVEKIKTNPYLVVSGCPEQREDHATCLLEYALAARQALKASGTKQRVKIGIHTGKVSAGILGSTKFLYDVFGNTINTASRLTSSAEWGTIQVSDQVKDVTEVNTHFVYTRRGEMDLKGLGNINIWAVTEDTNQGPLLRESFIGKLPTGLTDLVDGMGGSTTKRHSDDQGIDLPIPGQTGAK